MIGVLKELPPDIAYLAEPAMKYGVYQFDEEIFDFLDNATHDELEELAALAERVKIHGHYALVNGWLDRYEITDYEESANLYFLFLVMDYADLQFDEAPDDD